jgi:hypothetical protein
MRFHSVLFAETLDVPFTAIDYTNGGKIQAYLRRRRRTERLIQIEDLRRGNWRSSVA